MKKSRISIWVASDETLMSRQLVKKIWKKNLFLSQNFLLFKLNFTSKTRVFRGVFQLCKVSRTCNRGKNIFHICETFTSSTYFFFLKRSTRRAAHGCKMHFSSLGHGTNVFGNAIGIRKMKILAKKVTDLLLQNLDFYVFLSNHRNDLNVFGWVSQKEVIVSSPHNWFSHVINFLASIKCY